MIEKDTNTTLLLEKISRLEKENCRLKEILKNAGIDYEAAISDEQLDPSAQYDPDQGARIHPFDVTDLFFVECTKLTVEETTGKRKELKK